MVLPRDVGVFARWFAAHLHYSVTIFHDVASWAGQFGFCTLKSAGSKMGARHMGMCRAPSFGFRCGENERFQGLLLGGQGRTEQVMILLWPGFAT
jgi:hypothetical protein